MTLPWLLLLLLDAGWLAGYLVACRWWPYASCLRCHGTGKRRSPSGQSWRHCPRCHGTGHRLRVGRRLINHYSDDAQKATS